MNTASAAPQVPSGVACLLSTQFRQWTDNPRVLALNWQHYQSVCPPLLFIGGSGIQPSSAPLVIVSIEPLLASHFARQTDFASLSIDNYTRWNWFYFSAFPEIVGGEVQRYWRYMAAFVEGFSGSVIDGDAPWPCFARVLIELPYVPMHAVRHRPAASRQARQALRDLFVARVDVLSELWPDATFVVLASTVRRELEAANLLDGLVGLDLSMTADECVAYGNAFTTPLAAGRLATRTRPRVFVRNGPFTRGTNPRAEGRRELGRRVAGR